MLFARASSPVREEKPPCNVFPRPWRPLPRRSQEPWPPQRRSWPRGERQAGEQRRLAQEQDEAAWRAAFRPHAVILTERMVPSQIFFCGAMGGTERFRIIRFEDTRAPVTFVPQVLKALPGKVNPGGFVPFFGKALGFVVNYSPDQAVRYDLDGTPVEVLPTAYRIGEVQLWIGKKRVEPEFMARLLAGDLRSPDRDV